jgi:tetratricopeptide (TPR) repeat protein
MRRKGIAAVLFCFTVLLLFPSMTVRADGTLYTYTYDYWGIYRESPDAFKATSFITGESLGIGDFKDPGGMFVKDNRIYVCDTGNNRIVVLEKKDNDVILIDQYSDFSGDSSVNTFSGPNDIYVADNGDMYICDTLNQRVVHLNSERKLIKELVRPVDETVDQKGDFLPLKTVVDKSGRILVLVKNYNKGFIQYKNTGEFSGFIGANEVKFQMIDYLWKMVSTKAQRAQMAQFVPTEYNNLSLDKDGFIYCTTSVFKTDELRSDKAKPIRKLNAMGTDILIKNGEYPPIGDLDWGNAAGITGPSKLIDITALDNDTYYAIDLTRGRIFGYDSQGNLLYAFGSVGNRMGYFQYPTALDHMGNDLLVLDGNSGGITILTLTNFGQLINDALDEYKKGNYDDSARYWEQVLMQNGNYDLAYIGIGHSLFRQKKYKEAMEYYKLKYDDDHYSKAFQLYRKEWIEKNIVWIVTIFFALIIIPSFIGFVKKIQREVDE